jgi:hypothetical protein
MNGDMTPLPKYAFMALCSVKSTGTTLLYLILGRRHVICNFEFYSAVEGERNVTLIVSLSLCLTKYHAMEIFRGVEV